ncbi:4'-phosphopantetheinyl transferase family protein [Leadbetterella byssophila]|uniref:4'-phosphopantetheinyl transferase family protein n=1 Tax=Leadbetterella byssophila TaxID=316068 RepID=UPI0039A0F7D4
MPLILQESIGKDGTLFLWEVKEPLSPNLSPKSLERLRGMKNEAHKACFIAIRHLLEFASYADQDLYYDAKGKPFLKDGRPVSISHNGKLAALYIGGPEAGIDVQQVLPDKITKAAALFSEERDPEKLTKEWCIKEAVFKLSDSKPLNFLTDISIEKDKVQSRFKGWEKNFVFLEWKIEDYYLVCVTEDYLL